MHCSRGIPSNVFENVFMTSGEVKAGVAEVLCTRFVNLHEGTRRRDLVVKFKNPQILSEMEQQTLCRSQDNQKQYLPTVGSFALIADTKLVERARLGTLKTIHTLKNLFEVCERDEPYSFSDLEAHAHKIYDDVDPEMMRVGLYLSVDLGALGSYKRSDNGIEIESFTIPEHILSIENPERTWDDRAEGARRQAKGALFSFVGTEAPFGLEEVEYPSIEGTRDWYFRESVRMKQKTLRCPFAQPDLCPHYYQSLSLSGELGATVMDPTEASRLEAKWNSSPPFALLREQLPSVHRGEGTFSSLANFCPEVTYDILSVFASTLGRHVDEIDRDLAHEKLSRRNASSAEPYWAWGFVVPLHYTSCPTFSVIAGRGLDTVRSQETLLEALLAVPGADIDYISQQVDRMSASIVKDPELAIGTAKEVVETCCKTILKSLGIESPTAPKLPALVKLTIKSLSDSSGSSVVPTQAAHTINTALGTLVAGIAELRNMHGTGHGKTSGSQKIGARQATLAVAAASALCIYFADALAEVSAPRDQTRPPGTIAS
jgi:hypothetical protein